MELDSIRDIRVDIKLNPLDINLNPLDIQTIIHKVLMDILLRVTHTKTETNTVV
jgi:hypothetical protein